MDISNLSGKQSIKTETDAMKTETDDSNDKIAKKIAVKFVDVESKVLSVEGGACYLSDSERSVEIVNTPDIILDDSINIKTERLFENYDILECRQENFDAVCLKLENLENQNSMLLEGIEKTHRWIILISEKLMLGCRLELMESKEMSSLHMQAITLCDSVDIYICVWS